MTITPKILAVYLMLFGLHAYADELSIDMQKACLSEQLSLHKGIKGHVIDASNFNEYCKCETDHITSRATKEQFNQISKKQATKSNWLTLLKSNAVKSCTSQEKQITT